MSFLVLPFDTSPLPFQSFQRNARTHHKKEKCYLCKSHCSQVFNNKYLFPYKQTKDLSIRLYIKLKRKCGIKSHRRKLNLRCFSVPDSNALSQAQQCNRLGEEQRFATQRRENPKFQGKSLISISNLKTYIYQFRFWLLRVKRWRIAMILTRRRRRRDRSLHRQVFYFSFLIFFILALLVNGDTLVF